MVSAVPAVNGPLGQVSLKISAVTLNLIDSPASMKRSCLFPSPVSYSHTQACSVSSNLEGCWRAEGGMRMSSKKPSETTRMQIVLKGYKILIGSRYEIINKSLSI